MELVVAALLDDVAEVVLDVLPLLVVLLIMVSLFVVTELAAIAELGVTLLVLDTVWVLVVTYEVVIKDVWPFASVDVMVDVISVTTVAVIVDWPT